MDKKVRLDILLADRGLCPSRERAKTTVMAGLVYVDGQKADKPGQLVGADAALDVREDGVGFVSRGGLKLQKALDDFAIDVSGRAALDCGASTGGFTDCLLKRGARRVWAIDVGYGQLAWNLRNDPRVTCMERFNVRHLTPEHLDERPDLAVIDVSFISLGLVLPVVAQTLDRRREIVCLVKPQFEAGRERVGKNGVVRDAAVHRDVLDAFCAMVERSGLFVRGVTFSPVKGPKGNIEFLAHAHALPGAAPVDLGETVRSAHEALDERGER